MSERCVISPAGKMGVPIPPFPDRSSCKDAAVSFNVHGHRLSSLYRMNLEALSSFNALEKLKILSVFAGGEFEYLGDIERGRARHV